MTELDKTAKRDVRQLAGLVITTVVWAGTFVLAHRLLDGDPSPARRMGAVALGIAGVLPWIWMAARAIVFQDEFTRRIHFVALSWAFAATGVFVFAADLLTTAHVIEDLSYTTTWMFMLVAWWVSILFASRYYR